MNSRTFISEDEIDRALPQTFLAKVSPEPNSGCWLWAGSWNTTGYGNFWWGGKCHTAHRFIYERLFGEQRDLEIDHLCRVTCCVNPSHLEAVTRDENQKRRVGLGAANRKKTHCKNGHPLSGDNLEIIQTTDGHKRRCIICRNSTQRAYTARKAEKLR